MQNIMASDLGTPLLIFGHQSNMKAQRETFERKDEVRGPAPKNKQSVAFLFSVCPVRGHNGATFAAKNSSL